MSLPRIGLTIGDPGGIGPEIVLKSLSASPALPKARYIIFGSRDRLAAEGKSLGISLKVPPYEDDREGPQAEITIKHVEVPAVEWEKGRPAKENGQASFQYFQEAVEFARAKKIDAIVTAPVSKESWGLAGLPWRGHTEYLEHFYPDAIMTFWSGKMIVALLSHHLPLKEALKKVTKENLLRFLRILRESFNLAKPGPYEVLVAGLNPHAGESGILGEEERTEIGPAVEEARLWGWNISGPYPPDVVFREALGHPEKIVVSLYHDQGLIPFKLTAFETGVNVTLGMPFIRSSPDHGTAFDIAGENAADPRSMIEAVRLAFALTPRSF
jgi:4-hydroxythreonine-4-phosphate dehydrogenase